MLARSVVWPLLIEFAVTKNGEVSTFMYDRSTSSAPSSGASDERFQNILQHAVDTISIRLKSYDPGTDPLKKSHLKLLFDIVSSEIDRTAAGLAYIYAGLDAPIRAVCDWGEPPDSELTAALRNAETFFRSNYRMRSIRGRSVH